MSAEPQLSSSIHTVLGADAQVRELLFNLVTSYHKSTKTFLLEDVDLDTLPEVMYRVRGQSRGSFDG